MGTDVGQGFLADVDVLIASCLLHDIGRQEQFADPKICHARAGAKKAYDFLKENGFSDEFSKKVSQCILTHRYRRSNLPESLEAKILFDADKIVLRERWVSPGLWFTRERFHSLCIRYPGTAVCWMGKKKSRPPFFRNTNISWRESIPVFHKDRLRDRNEPEKGGGGFLQQYA